MRRTRSPMENKVLQLDGLRPSHGTVPHTPQRAKFHERAPCTNRMRRLEVDQVHEAENLAERGLRYDGTRHLLEHLQRRCRLAAAFEDRSTFGGFSRQG